MPMDVMGKNADKLPLPGQRRAVPFGFGHAFDPMREGTERMICQIRDGKRATVGAAMGRPN